MLHQSPHPVAKCIARRRAVIQLQELVQLIRGDEAAVQHLAQQRIILCGTEGNRSFPVASSFELRTTKGIVDAPIVPSLGTVICQALRISNSKASMLWSTLSSSSTRSTHGRVS